MKKVTEEERSFRRDGLRCPCHRERGKKKKKKKRLFRLRNSTTKGKRKVREREIRTGGKSGNRKPNDLGGLGMIGMDEIGIGDR